jgi:hypothetical protein
MLTKQRLIAAIALPIVGIALTAGCGGETEHSGHDMASLDKMPEEIQRAPKPVREAYQFAVANPRVLRQVPCYCGCGGMGHTSNYSCYVGVSPSGAKAFDGHALGCSICVDIALDAMRLLEEGKSIPQIRDYIDATYSEYGPSNML